MLWMQIIEIYIRSVYESFHKYNIIRLIEVSDVGNSKKKNKETKDIFINRVIKKKHLVDMHCCGGLIFLH